MVIMIKNGKHIIKLLFYIAMPTVLIALPKDFFDTGQTVCLSQKIFDIECYGCGMTSAIMHLVHLDFEVAYAYNMLSFLVFPILSFLWAKWAFKELCIIKKLQST